MTRSMMEVIIEPRRYDPFSLCSASMKKLPIVTTCSPGFRPSSDLREQLALDAGLDFPRSVLAAAVLHVDQRVSAPFR